MKFFLVLVCVVVAYAEDASGGYSYPSAPSQSFGTPNLGGGNRFLGGGSNIAQGGQTFRHVYVHVAPDEPVDEQARVIRVPGGQDKHVNIIFVKTPSGSASQQTEVILPEQDQQKTVVYVLERKFNAETDLKIRAPRPTSPSKPDVYFIRYKDQQGASQTGSSSTGNVGGAQPAYGVPAF